MKDKSKVYSTKNYGDFRIVDSTDKQKIKVEFIKTGYVAIVQSGQIRTGGFKDKLSPSVFGIGYIGNGNRQLSINCKMVKSYRVWKDMLMRCYSDSFQLAYQSYKGCSVCDEWHSYHRFADWFDQNYIKGYQLDKDIKVEGSRAYSPDACSFVSAQNNAAKALAKSYIFRSKDGGVVNVYNLSKFCRDNKLTRGNMHKVINGERKQHKGWSV